ncbi:hypothetical protein BHM03_00003788 [Ensete ventricosum]|nr:hypothetical protein BHM03_00003788 [Ensete ventricosum]
MERHDPTLATTRVHVLDLCLRKTLCLRSMFYLLHRLPSCGLDTAPSSTQVVLPLDCIELMVALAPTIPRFSPLLSPIFTWSLSVPLFDVAMVASSLDLAMHPLIHYLMRDHATTLCRSLSLSFVELLS